MTRRTVEQEQAMKGKTKVVPNNFILCTREGEPIIKIPRPCVDELPEYIVNAMAQAYLDRVLRVAIHAAVRGRKSSYHAVECFMKALCDPSEYTTNELNHPTPTTARKIRLRKEFENNG